MCRFVVDLVKEYAPALILGITIYGKLKYNRSIRPYIFYALHRVFAINGVNSG